MKIRWLFGNSTQEHGAGDYQIRLCDEGLWEYSKSLDMLSRRLIAINSREMAGMESQDAESWFAGYLDQEKTIYLVAVGGMQRTLLGSAYPLEGGYREQYCVMAYGFTEEADLELYWEQILRRDSTMFEPLKEIMWKKPPKWSGKAGMKSFSAARPGAGQNNIFASSPERNASLWENSRNCPAALDIISLNDAKKMIALLPGLVVTVKEDIAQMCYLPPNEMFPKKNLFQEKSFSQEISSGRMSAGMVQKLEPEQRNGRQEKQETKPQQKDRPKKTGSNVSLKEVVVGFLEGCRSSSKAEDAAGKTADSRREKIKEAAERCREELDDALVEQIVNEVMDVKKELGLHFAEAKQIEYGCLMSLWLNKDEAASDTENEKLVKKIVRDCIKDCWKQKEFLLEEARKRNEELMRKVQKKH